MSFTTGDSTSVLLGHMKLSAEGSVKGITPTKVKVAVAPTLEATHRSELVGSALAQDMTFELTRFGLQFELMTALTAKTAYAFVSYIRGAPGNIMEMVEGTTVQAQPATDTPDELESRTMGLAAGDGGIYRMSRGLLFDHTMAHSAGGVTAPVNGTGVQVGAVSATQSVTLFWANPHDPAPTVEGGVAHVESDATDAWVGAETTRGVAFATATSTPAWETQTIAGPITDTWWRLSITAVTSGAFYPVCGIVIHDT